MEEGEMSLPTALIDLFPQLLFARRRCPIDRLESGQQQRESKVNRFGSTLQDLDATATESSRVRCSAPARNAADTYDQKMGA